MKPNPVDGPTFARTNAVLTDAHTRGLSAVEELNRVGLLLTPAREKLIQTETISALLDDLTRWRPAELIRRRLRNAEAGTPNDMYMSILGYIEEYLTVMREKT